MRDTELMRDGVKEGIMVEGIRQFIKDWDNTAPEFRGHWTIDDLRLLVSKAGNICTVCGCSDMIDKGHGVFECIGCHTTKNV